MRKPSTDLHQVEYINAIDDDVCPAICVEDLHLLRLVMEFVFILDCLKVNFMNQANV